MNVKTFSMVPTTQGPFYPPSEVMDQNGNFVVVGKINRKGSLGNEASWGAAIVAVDPAPKFGTHRPYRIIEELDEDDSARLEEIVLHTLPLPLPSNNYPMLFAPEQLPEAHSVQRPSIPLHIVRYPDEQEIDGPKRLPPITLSKWLKARGIVTVTWSKESAGVDFKLDMSGLLPNSLYTVMTLKAWDLRPENPTRPGPLGIPNVFISNENGEGHYAARLPCPFPEKGNRVINIVVLWMSEQRNYGGAIGQFGLGGDIHAQLKLKNNTFFDIQTR
ncbi:hypothetical protein [Corynebacterium freiburgense]|uniref:hypothetical protein n=1 Tax=Corynebacterium freiburgense TaxID=556548 RepID=UPI00040E2961|nr:hypothetical protein [Corynebacterium freiburgense]WJZ02942.1 hypothetical protein CFREI_08320 [Corynebacterium freiburgense]